jgi:hypothetical protein
MCQILSRPSTVSTANVFKILSDKNRHIAKNLTDKALKFKKDKCTKPEKPQSPQGQRELTIALYGPIYRLFENINGKNELVYFAKLEKQSV